MRVRCVSNAYRDLPATSSYHSPDAGDSTFFLEIDKEYIVYGLWGRGDEVSFSILDNEYSRYPNWFPSSLFEVVDGRLPSCWRFLPLMKATTPSFVITFPEWISVKSFNLNVIERDIACQEIWQ